MLHHRRHARPTDPMPLLLHLAISFSLSFSPTSQVLVQLRRRECFGVGLIPLLLPLAAPAAQPSRDDALNSLSAAEQKLRQCAQLVSSTPSIEQLREALEIVGSRELDRGYLASLFEVVTEKPTATEKAMNNAAFIVYYEEARYKDTRLEPQAPGLRAQQNGFMRETLSNLGELKAELIFLTDGSAEPDDEDLYDVERYARAADGALSQYISFSKK